MDKIKAAAATTLQYLKDHPKLSAVLAALIVGFVVAKLL